MNTYFGVFGLRRLGIEPKSTISVADALFTRQLSHHVVGNIQVSLKLKNDRLTMGI